MATPGSSLAATKHKKSEEKTKTGHERSERKGKSPEEQSITTTHHAEGEKILLRLRMPYIGRLSSRVGTIESRRGWVDALPDLQTIEAMTLCACVSATENMRRTGKEAGHLTAVDCWRMGNSHISTRNPFSTGHLGRT